jgi:SAM-dependent methyltransferase
MKNSEQIKQLVQEKYSWIAKQSKKENVSFCCGTSCCTEEVHNIMTDDYSSLKGYNPGADLGLGCGLPTQHAKIKPGDTVVDLGSGAGNDCFIARAETGETGKVIGIDFTDEMIAKARENVRKTGYNNVEFIKGEIENIPLPAGTADVVVSNCVLNLVPDKQKAFSEIFRVLKAGGHFSISDIVLEGALPGKIREAAEMYAGCVAGALQKEEYLEAIQKAGFSKIIIQKEKNITIPDDILLHYLTREEAEAFRNSGTGIYSITVYGEKMEDCCGPECCS